ncbi:CHASE2 domain-containing protein [Nostoc spongiaeforme FACHB-130]|uniref:CHASE2 domain-containing protein n=1 Tax=Nostoc spongiaeforme FACHB-130 TaxID=1357510 RepID=A0ABR8FWZ5_9NOSO|nr:CHASE2 domain-containing protein [Nostoc spongiaeforme]MBD2595689.1 CHASE2 domain-containing protein [Nostoc spongiaeforme FACHB-130]
MVGQNSQRRNFRQTVITIGGTVVVTSVAIAGLILGLRELGSLQGMELAAFDWLMRSRPDEGVDNRFLIVGVDDNDIQTRKEYPIEDGTMAQLLTKLAEHEPRVIGIDILRDVKQGAAAGRADLMQILAENENIAAVCVLSKADSPGIAAAPGIPEDRVGVADFPVDAGGTVRQGMMISVPKASKLPKPSEHICNIADPENQLPSLSFQMVVRYLAAQGIEPQQTKSGELQFNSTVLKRLTLKAGGYHNIDTSDYQILLNYRSAKNAVKQVSLSDILADKVDPALIKDKIVMIGYTAQIVKDTFYTPYSAGAADSQKMPGVVVHAQNASQILSAVLDKRPLFWYWNEWQEGLWIFAWSLVGGFLAWQIRKPWLLILGGGVAIAVLLGSTYIIFLQAGWIPLVPPVLGLLGSAVAVVLIDRYAATIVKTVKGFLKINIDIDEDKKNQEIAAITESDYFLELQQKAKDLRGRDNIEDLPPTILPTVNNLETNHLLADTIISQPTNFEPTEIDYLQQVRDRRNQLNSQETLLPQNPNNNLEITTTPTTIEEPDELEYLADLQRRSKKLKENK